MTLHILKRSLFGAVLASWAVSGAWAADFAITASDIKDGERLGKAQVLNGFGCEGGNVSPQIAWSGAPEGTRSFAVTLYDPDAPTGSGWWHWVVFDIPASTTHLMRGAGTPESGTLPDAAVQSRTDFGGAGFGGACPPPGHGPHRYQLTVHALDVVKLELDEDAPAAMVGFYLGQHSLAQAKVTGIYTR